MLLLVDLLSGYVIAKASSSGTAQTIAMSYEECLCFKDLGPVNRFATIERQDSCPISSERLIGSRGRNNIQHGVPTSSEWDSRTIGADIDESLKMYVTDTIQKYWYEYAERFDVRY